MPEEEGVPPQGLKRPVNEGDEGGDGETGTQAKQVKRAKGEAATTPEGTGTDDGKEKAGEASGSANDDGGKSPVGKDVGTTPPSTSRSFESTSKDVREFLLKAASTAARDTGAGANEAKTPSGFGGGFGAFNAGPDPRAQFAKQAGSGFGGGFGSVASDDAVPVAKQLTLLESIKHPDTPNDGESPKAGAKTPKPLTGEEGEETTFEDQAKVYRFDAQELKWRERGKGELKIKKRHNDSGDARFRLLLREPNTQRILVNMSIMSTMSHEISKNVKKQVRITGVNSADSSQAISAFMIMLKTSDIASELDGQLSAAIVSLGEQDKTAPAAAATAQPNAVTTTAATDPPTS